MKSFKKTGRSLVALLMIGIASVGLAMQQATLTYVVTKATPNVAVTSSSPGSTSTAGSSTFGTPVTFTATITSDLGSAATGSVTFFDNGTQIGSPINVTALPNKGTTNTVSIADSSLVNTSGNAGAHTITATYSGDANFNPVMTDSTTFVETVTTATPSVTLSSTPNASTYQNAVTFTATVSALATGTVSFVDETIPASPVTLASNVAISGTTASFTAPNTLAAGTHNIVAMYSGDANFSAFNSSADAQVVNKANTITTVTATPSTGLTLTEPVTLTALVNTGVLAPTSGDTVTFNDGANPLAGSSQVTISSVSATNLLPYSSKFAFGGTTSWTAINTGGTSATIGSTVTGPDTVTGSATAISFPATPSGNFAGIQTNADTVASGVATSAGNTGNYAGDNMVVSFWAQSDASASFAGSLTVRLADGSGNNLAVPVTTGADTVVVPGTWQRITVPFTMSASAAAGATVSIESVNQANGGSVDIFGVQLEDKPSVANMAGVYVLTQGTALQGFGAMATFTTSTLAQGSHPITAMFSGDSNFIGSTSTTDTLTLSQVTPNITVSSSSTNNTSVYGTSVTFTVNVTDPSTGGAVPSGTVSLIDSTGQTITDSSTSSTSITLNGSGTATFTTALLGSATSGSLAHAITVAYTSNSGNFNSVANSSSLANTNNSVTQTVTQATATVSAVSSSTGNTSSFGVPVTFTFTVTGVTGGITPTGTVTVTDAATAGATTLTPTSITLNLTNGVATLPTDVDITSILTAGTHNLTITYSGDPNYK